jgi:hypothetical protein
MRFQGEHVAQPSATATGSRWKRWGIAVCLTALAVLVSATAATPAEASEPTVLVHFYDSGQTSASTMVCAPGAGSFVIHGNVTWGTEAGDSWHGVSAYDICVYPLSTPGRFWHYGVETFTGTVDNCGTGTMTWHIQGALEVGTDNFGSVWELVRAAGTGGLENASGVGVSHVFVAPTFENYGYFSGIFHCGH